MSQRRFHAKQVSIISEWTAARTAYENILVFDMFITLIRV